jgi:hypothetical protein
MGNQSTNSIRGDIAGQRVVPLLTMSDCYIGNYVILQDRSRPDSLFMLTELNPENYDQYTVDYEEFQRKIESSNEGICTFLSIDPSECNPEVYEMVFEFGHFLLVLENAKSIWEFIHQAVASLSFLEANGLHFPFVRKKYFVYLQSLRRFKIVNPFAFPSFIADYMRVYSDSNVSSVEKAHFLKGKLNVNVRELGFVVLSLIFNIDEASFIQSPVLIRSKVRETRTKFGDELFAFVSFLIECRAQLTFRDVQTFLKTGGHPLFPNPLTRTTLERPERSSEFKMSLQGSFSSRLGPRSLPGTEKRETDIRSSVDETRGAQDPRQPKMSYDPSSQTVNSNLQVDKIVPPPLTAKPALVFSETKPASAEPESGRLALEKTDSVVSSASDGNLAAKKGARLVKKRIRWVAEKQCHMEVLEFDDGSTEERVPQNQEMLKQIMKDYQAKMAETSIQAPQAPHAPKPSAMHLYNPETLAAKAGDVGTATANGAVFSIVLFLQDASQSGKVIFKNSLANLYDSFFEMREVVDQQDPLKPSVYHDDSVNLFEEFAGKGTGEPKSEREDQETNYKVRTIEAHPFSAHSN